MNKTVVYYCAESGNMGSELTLMLTNLDEQGHYANVSFQAVTQEEIDIAGDDQLMPETDWTEVERLEVPGTTFSNREKSTFGLFLDFSPSGFIKIEGDLDADLDIVVEGEFYGECQAHLLEEE